MSFFIKILCSTLVGLGMVCVMNGCSRSSDASAKAEEDSSQLTGNEPIKAGIATIDVNKIARDSGKLSEINLAIDKKGREFDLILEGVRKIHLQEVTKLETTHGKEPTEEQLKEISSLRLKQASEYNRRWQETRLQLTAIKQRLDEQFLANVQPIAKQVAEEKGLSVVIRKENVFCTADQFDITNNVSEKFLEVFPKPKEQAAAIVAQMPLHGGSFVPKTK